MRDQWRPVPVPYLTFSGNYDMKIYPKKRRKSFFGVGAIFNYDRSGSASYNITDLNLTGSYSYILTKRNIITAGVLLGFATEGFTTKGIAWDTQWNGDSYDPNLSSNENFLNGERVNYLETGVGLNYRYQKSARTNFNLGIGAWHLNTPNTTFFNDITIDIPVRVAYNFTGSFQLANAFDIQLHANYNQQKPYSETVFGGLLRMHINQNAGKKYALDLGASYRTSGFLIPTLAVHYNQWYIGASYDIDMGVLNAKHDFRKGGPEVHVRYIITNVQPMEEKKACPIF